MNVITLGCSKNIFDSEVMMAQLKANQFEVAHDSEENDSEIKRLKKLNSELYRQLAVKVLE